jgi:hypothetical protein
MLFARHHDWRDTRSFWRILHSNWREGSLG